MQTFPAVNNSSTQNDLRQPLVLSTEHGSVNSSDPEEHRRLGKWGVIWGMIVIFIIIGGLGLLYFLLAAPDMDNLRDARTYGENGSATFCETVPCMQLGSLMITQPGSTLIVIILALEYLAVGILVLQEAFRHGACLDNGCCFGSPDDDDSGKARAWWGYAFAMWGISVLFAGSSFQCLTFQIRCEGDPHGVSKCVSEREDFCAQFYYILQACGMNLFVVARSYRAVRPFSNMFKAYTAFHTFLYLVLVIFVPVFRGYLTNVVFIMPSYTLLRIVNVMCIGDNVLHIAWSIMGASFLVWLTYMKTAPYMTWWKDGGVWFSENDALHVCLIPFVPLAYWSVIRVKDAAPERIHLTDFGRKVVDRWNITSSYIEEETTTLTRHMSSFISRRGSTRPPIPQEAL